MFKHYFAFNTPTTIFVVGPSQSGKTEFVINLLKNKHLFSKEPKRIIWAYGQRNDDQMTRISEIDPSIEFVEGLPNTNDFNPNTHNLLILDDLMDELGQSSDVSKLFTRGSHHKNITVIAILHNVFNKAQFMRTLNVNTHYFVFFDSARDVHQIENLGRQSFLGQKVVAEAYKDAVSQPYGYLILDMKTGMNPKTVRVLTGIFPDELPIVYVPKNEIASRY